MGVVPVTVEGIADALILLAEVLQALGRWRESQCGVNCLRTSRVTARAGQTAWRALSIRLIVASRAVTSTGFFRTATPG
jgi:hypothetical protein